MRRSILVATTAAAFMGALAAGPFGAAAAAPYVYGCTPAAWFNDIAGHVVMLSIYNGSTSTASLTHKVLAGDGTILNPVLPGGFPPPITSSLAATKTVSFDWNGVGGVAAPNDSTTQASVRIVSNVPVAANIAITINHPDYSVIPCQPLIP